MKAFRFALQSVRVLRERKEQLAQQRYAGALRARDQALAQLHTANAALACAWEESCRQLAAGSPAAELRRSLVWRDSREHRQQECAAELHAAEHAVDVARRELTETARDRQAMDSLHDKRRRAYDLEIQRAEQKRLDEMGLQMAAAGRAWRGLPTGEGV